MIKDVRTYFNTVGQRLTNAFKFTEFNTETELEFWNTSAEHMSRKKNPSFQDISNWIDILYHAPVHIVYRKKDDELILFKRIIKTENILPNHAEGKDETLTDVEKKIISDFEQQVENLQNKKKWYPEFQEHNVSSHSIGNCEHIPVFDEQGDVWGIYVVGPNTKCPEAILPKLSIVGRLLSIWLIQLESADESNKKDYQTRMEGIASELGSGALNTEALVGLFMRYYMNSIKSEKAAVFELHDEKATLIFNEHFNEQELNSILSQNGKSAFILSGDEIIPSNPSTNLDEILGDANVTPIIGKFTKGFFITSATNQDSEKEEINREVKERFASLLDYRNSNIDFTKRLIESYYSLLRDIEKSRPKTEFHTLRMIGFVEKFAMLFGLEDEETEILKTTAMLHDIGYVGGLSLDKDVSIGSEMNHPLTGYKLVDQLPIHEDIKKGILTHHEWVNGNGSPSGLNADEIQWTGKVIGVFEFIVDFIETYKDDDSKNDEEWMEVLAKNVMERADKQFDMVLIPTIVQLIQMLGWRNCCEVGIEL